MFWTKIKTAEYLELKKLFENLKLEVESQKLELQLYVKKLKAKKGISEEKEEEQKDIYKGMLLPDNGII